MSFEINNNGGIDRLFDQARLVQMNNENEEYWSNKKVHGRKRAAPEPPSPPPTPPPPPVIKTIHFDDPTLMNGYTLSGATETSSPESLGGRNLQSSTGRAQVAEGTSLPIFFARTGLDFNLLSIRYTPGQYDNTTVLFEGLSESGTVVGSSTETLSSSSTGVISLNFNPIRTLRISWTAPGTVTAGETLAPLTNQWNPSKDEYFFIPTNMDAFYNFVILQGQCKFWARTYAPRTPSEVGIVSPGVPNEVGNGFFYQCAAWILRDNPNRSNLDSLLTTVTDPSDTTTKLAEVTTVADANWNTAINPVNGQTFATRDAMVWFLFWRNDIIYTIQNSLPTTEARYLTDAYFDSGWSPATLESVYGFPSEATYLTQYPNGGEKWNTSTIPPMTSPWEATGGVQKIPRPVSLELYWSQGLDQSFYGNDKWKYYDEVYNWWFKDGDPPNDGSTITGPVHPTDDHFTPLDIGMLEAWFFGNRSTEPTYSIPDYSALVNISLIED